MIHSSPAFPSQAEGLALHLRLCADDPVATADLCAAYVGPLVHRLTAAYPKLDPHLVQTAVHDAVVAYLRRPSAYVPARQADLAAYLRMAARRDLLNGLRGEARAHRRHTPRPVVELGPAAGNIPGKEAEPPLACQRAEEAQRRVSLLARLADGFTDGERRVLGLMLDGERATPVFAAVLGLGGRPSEEQEREVKRTKDRILKRLKRGGDNDG